MLGCPSRGLSRAVGRFKDRLVTEAVWLQSQVSQVMNQVVSEVVNQVAGQVIGQAVSQVGGGGPVQPGNRFVSFVRASGRREAKLRGRAGGHAVCVARAPLGPVTSYAGPLAGRRRLRVGLGRHGEGVSVQVGIKREREREKERERERESKEL